MSYLIDRRLNGKNKSAVNRQRFLRRYHGQIKKAVADAVGRRTITDIDHGEKISIPGRDIDEPVFHHGRGGRRDHRAPGQQGVHHRRTHSAPARRRWRRARARAAPATAAKGMDDFVFQITAGGVPRLHVRGSGAAQSGQAPARRHRQFQDACAPAISTDGTPANIKIVRSLRAAPCAPHRAVGGRSRATHARTRGRAGTAANARSRTTSRDIRAALRQRSSRLRARDRRACPFIDTFDLNYNLRVTQPQPTSPRR